MPDNIKRITFEEVDEQGQSRINFIIIDKLNDIQEVLGKGQRQMDNTERGVGHLAKKLTAHKNDRTAHPNCNGKKTRKEYAKDAGIYFGLPSLLASIIYGVIELLK